MRAGTEATSEVGRQLVHVAFGAAGLLLRYLQWWQAVLLMAAAVLFNIALIRAAFRGRLHRAHERARTLPPAIVLYPASLLLLLLVLPSRPDIVAACWGILAAGDGAATIVGTRFGRRRWPWNPRKSVAGSTAFVLVGAAAGAFLAWWCRPAVVPPPYLWFSIAAPIAAACAAAAVETLPMRLDDNLSVPLSSAAVLWAASLVDQDLAIEAARTLPSGLLVALPSNAAVAWAGFAAGTVSRSGAAAGMLIGTVILASMGWGGWILLLTGFAFAAGTSRVGLERKVLLGIAEERGGRRGAGNAFANTGVAAVAGILAAVSPAQGAAAVAFTAALTAGASDTVASEIGKAWGRRTWAILPPGRAAPGTPGAMSLPGTLAGAFAAALLGALAVALGIIPAEAWSAVVAGAVAGALAESLLAAQFEPEGVLNNDALNLINTVVAAYLAVRLSAGPGA